MTNQEAIEELKLLESEQRYDTEYTDFDCFKLAIKALEQQDKERWIPVSERLPEEHEKLDDIFDSYTLAVVDLKTYMVSDLVLVTVRDYELDTDFTMDDMTVDGKWTNFESDGRYEVISWKPMPEPYKEDYIYQLSEKRYVSEFHKVMDQ